MPRDIPIGTGSLLILYDRTGFVRDLYFPGVGSENHAQGHAFGGMTMAGISLAFFGYESAIAYSRNGFSWES
jgi:hypothetical protein